jgi:hypothetical protein
MKVYDLVFAAGLAMLSAGCATLFNAPGWFIALDAAFVFSVALADLRGWLR